MQTFTVKVYTLDAKFICCAKRTSAKLAAQYFNKNKKAGYMVELISPEGKNLSGLRTAHTSKTNMKKVTLAEVILSAMQAGDEHTADAVLDAAQRVAGLVNRNVVDAHVEKELRKAQVILSDLAEYLD